MKTNLFFSRAWLLVLFALISGGQRAHAEIRFNGTLDTRSRIHTSAQVVIRPTAETQDQNPVVDNKSPAEVFEAKDFEQSLASDAKKEGLSAKGRARQRTNVNATANSLTVTSTGSTEAQATRTGDILKDGPTQGEGSTTFKISFNVDGRSTYSLTASGSIDTNVSEGGNNVLVKFNGSGQDPDDETPRVEINEEREASDGLKKPRSFNLSRSGELKPGAYHLSVSTFANLNEKSPTSRTKYNLTLKVSSVPAEPELFLSRQLHWIHKGTGAFAVPGNWSPHDVPAVDDTHADGALFDLRGSYAVTLGGGSRAVDLIRVKNGGTINLSGGELSAVSLDINAPSFIATGNAKLLLTGGTLDSFTSILGNDAGSFGEVRVMNAGSVWNAFDLTVGGEGKGRLTVEAGGQLFTGKAVVGSGPGLGSATIKGEGSLWDTTDLKVGFPGSGNLLIKEGATLKSRDQMRIGRGSGDSLVIVFGLGATGIPSTLLSSAGGVFLGGPGFLEVVDGGVAQLPAGLGDLDGQLNIDSLAGVTVRGVTGAQRSTLEAEGIEVSNGGFLSIEDGGLVKCHNLFISTGGVPTQVAIDGFSAAGDLSELQVNSPDQDLPLEGQLNITFSGKASITCRAMQLGLSGGESGTIVVSTSNPLARASSLSITGDLTVGNAGAGGGAGLLQIADGTVVVNGNLNVSANGSIQGRGLLAVTGGTLHNSGTISPGLSPGILRLEGNFEQDETGVVTAEVAGPIPGTQHDQFIVTGTSAMGGKLVLQFINGFAPSAGAQFNVLSTTGAATGEFASVEVSGLEPGAEFQTALSNGVYTATAMNNTVALPTVSIRAVTKKAFEKGKRASALLISRTGNAASKVNPLTVNYKIGGSAGNGVDYTYLSGTVTIPALKNAVTLKLKPFDDRDIEGPETVELNVVPGPGYSNSLRSKALVTLVDRQKRPR